MAPDRAVESAPSTAASPARPIQRPSRSIDEMSLFQNRDGDAPTRVLHELFAGVEPGECGAELVEIENGPTEELVLLRLCSWKPIRLSRLRRSGECSSVNASS